MGEKIESVQALFEHDLKTMLWVERKLADEVLPELREMVHDADLKHDVEHHLSETKAHVRNLERVFELIHVKPEAEQSEVLKGLRKQHDEGMKMISEDDEALRDLFHTHVITKNEHVEIAAYNGLIELAEQLGEEDVAIALRENLEQEESALRKAEAASRKLLREEVRA
jgi:ferritin-like metal-binding protein YciE